MVFGTKGDAPPNIPRALGSRHGSLHCLLKVAENLFRRCVERGEATSDSRSDITDSVVQSPTRLCPPGIFEPVTSLNMDEFLRVCPRPTKVHPFVHFEPLNLIQSSLL